MGVRFILLGYWNNNDMTDFNPLPEPSVQPDQAGQDAEQLCLGARHREADDLLTSLFVVEERQSLQYDISTGSSRDTLPLSCHIYSGCHGKPQRQWNGNGIAAIHGYHSPCMHAR